MNNSLQDQLLRAGLTTKSKANKEKQNKHKKAKNKKSNKTPPIDEAKLLVQKAEQEKRQRDRELNQQKESLAKQKAIISQIKQLIETNKANLADGELAYNFEDSKIIKKIYVTNEIHEKISRGQFGIAKFDDAYHAIPAIVAKKINDRDPSYIIVLNDSKDSEEVDEQYTDYEIPDDLMW